MLLDSFDGEVGSYFHFIRMTVRKLRKRMVITTRCMHSLHAGKFFEMRLDIFVWRILIDSGEHGGGYI